MNLLVTAVMANGIIGEPPHLDALLECELSLHAKVSHQMTRATDAPPVGAIAIPIQRATFHGQTIAKCSSPILSQAEWDGVEKFSKQFDTSMAEALHPSERTVFASGSGPLKSYLLPKRRRVVQSICWFAVGDRRETLKLLRRMKSLGHKRAHGHGIVSEWTIVEAAEDYSWFAKSPAGRVLMRPLPQSDREKWIGSKADFGACQPPYWHPGRYMEIVVPC